MFEDREKLIANTGREDWNARPYPLSLEEEDAWFDAVFFIQWCDWRALQSVFCELDHTIRREKIHSSFSKIRQRLVFDDVMSGVQTTRAPSLCAPKIIRPSDF